MRYAVALPVAAPLLGSAVAVLCARNRLVQRVVAVAALAVGVAAALVLLRETLRSGSAVVVSVGGWPGMLGIELSVDLMSALLLSVSLVTVLIVLAFIIAQRSIDANAVVHPAYLVLTAGVALAFVTGDIFTLFVSFEMLLIASYVLLTIGGGRARVGNGMTYVVMNLLASTLFIAAVGFVYAACGTVNLSLLAARFPALDSGVHMALGLAFVVVFGIKAALFPLFSWLPDAYPAAPTPITAIFAGLLTKVGVYALIRTTTTLGLSDLGPILLVAAGLTMIVGVLGAIAQSDVKRILSFHIVSQIGYMVMGLGLFSVAGVAGAILFIVHQIPVKTALFLVGGLIEQREGSGALDRVGGLVRSAPVIAVLFLPVALSLAGLPPFSGFVAKLALIEAGAGAGEYAIVAVSLLGSLLTLFSMTKIWNGVFWGERRDPAEFTTRPSPEAGTVRATTAACAAAVALTLLIAVSAGSLYDWSVRAAEQVVGPAASTPAAVAAP